MWDFRDSTYPVNFGIRARPIVRFFEEKIKIIFFRLYFFQKCSNQNLLTFWKNFHILLVYIMSFIHHEVFSISLVLALLKISICNNFVKIKIMIDFQSNINDIQKALLKLIDFGSIWGIKPWNSIQFLQMQKHQFLEYQVCSNTVLYKIDHSFC